MSFFRSKAECIESLWVANSQILIRMALLMSATLPPACHARFCNAKTLSLLTAHSRLAKDGYAQGGRTKWGKIIRISGVKADE